MWRKSVRRSWPVVYEEGPQLGWELDIVEGWVGGFGEVAQSAEHLHPGYPQGVGESSKDLPTRQCSACFDVKEVSRR